MKRSALAAVAVLAAALLVSGCGGGSSGGSASAAPEGGKKATAPNAPAGSKVVPCKEDGLEAEELRATAVSCDVARATMTEWENDPICTSGGSSSRSACSIGDFRCQAVKVEAGTAVSCERKGAAVSWLVKPAG
jgi:hypothetical protein